MRACQTIILSGAEPQQSSDQRFVGMPIGGKPSNDRSGWYHDDSGRAERTFASVPGHGRGAIVQAVRARLEASGGQVARELALSFGPDWVVRRDAANALGVVGDNSTLGPLKEAEGDTQSEVREAASRALGDLAVRLVEETSDSQTDQEDADARRISDAYWESL